MVAIGDQRLVTDEAVRERDEGGEVAQGGLRIQAPDLERPERGVRSHVPPDRAGVRSLGDAAELRRRLRVVLPVSERSGRPVRGTLWHTTVRLLARPESCPCQNGEFALSACSSGIHLRMPLKAAIVVSPSGIPTWTCTPQYVDWRSSDRVSALTRS